MNLLTLDFQGMAVHASRDAWFNATEIAAMFGKQPYEWIRLPETEQYIQALLKRAVQQNENSNTGKSRISKSHFIKTKRGNSGGTWLHPKLAIAFARWLSPDFAVWCDEQIENLLHQHQQWQPARHELKSVTKLKNRLLRDQRAAHGKTTQSHHFINEALLEYEALTGKRHIVSRDLLDVTQIAALDAITAENTALIARDLSYQERKSRLLVFAKTLNYPPVQAHQRNAAKLRFHS
ncbi:KilA-N domain-containing protein [Conchiformibius steedae DSM 2580]|uniref:KilA-N domain-containing protein n=1 Tax=Conchiformibius steedae DSM 2580 TaxID=1121352 RepID=A0AAE9HVG7_9NEIS|nr:KilA-N domain-containing protein [Conchiformibius steedae]QMT34185.1 KilA-N domain-containing protein [Conchiformibius steedae]URD66960.1 KilA-N domain-containing protein [Conchiformibius steedae DSM 2580]